MNRRTVPRSHRMNTRADLPRTKSYYRYIFCFVVLSCLCVALEGFGTSVPATGYTNSFATQPAASDWATLSVTGGGGDSYDLDTDVNGGITAGIVIAQTVMSSSDPASANGLATWSSPGRYLQTRPTMNRYTVLMAKFVN